MATMQVPDCLIMTTAGPLGCALEADVVEARRALDPNGYIDLRILVQHQSGQTEEKPARVRADSIVAII